MKHYKYITNKITTMIYNITIDELLTHNPPCKECLVQPTCMYITEYITINSKKQPKLIVRACDKLHKFLKGEKCFKKL